MMPFSDQKKFTDITPEDISDIYRMAKEDPSFIYDMMKGYSSGIINGEEYGEPADNVKTIALHTSFTGWDTGHWTAIIDMANELLGAGYEVYLLHHSVPPAEAVSLTSAKMITLPKLYGSDSRTCVSTVRAIEEICIEHEIDAVIFNQYAKWEKFIDYLSFKRVRLTHTDRSIRCILQFHSSFQRMFKLEGSIGSDWLTENAPCMGIYDSLIAESEVDRRFWSAYNPNVFFRPLPISEDIAQLPLSSGDSKDIIYLARFSTTKNQMDMIKAMKKVVAKVPEARLILTGDNNWYTDKCKKYVHKNDLDDHILFAGFITGDEKTSYLKQAGIAVSTSRFEGYSLGLAECKSHGLPVVMYDIPNLTVRDGGDKSGTIVVPQHDIDAMAEAIVDLLNDDERRKELGRRSRAHMEAVYDIDYSDLWKRIFGAHAKSNEYMEDEIQQRLYQAILDAFAETYRNATSKIEEMKEMIEKLENGGEKPGTEKAGADNKPEPTSSADKERRQKIAHGRVVVSAPANGIMDRYISFDEEFAEAPHVVCSIYSTSSSPEIANLTCSAINATTNGCVLRVFNSGDSNRKPAITYIAVGK